MGGQQFVQYIPLMANHSCILFIVLERAENEKIRKEPGNDQKIFSSSSSHNLHNGETLHVNLLSLSDPVC